MKTSETSSAPRAAGSEPTTNGPPAPLAAAHEVRKRGGFGKIVLFLIVVGLAGAAGYTWMVGVAKARQDANQVLSYVEHYMPSSHSAPSASLTTDTTPPPPWDGFVRVKTDQAKSIGLLVSTVQPQTEPIKLPLMGRTDYDPNTQSKIRPRFDTLVERVLAERGQVVEKGAPLVDLYSSDLAEAKNLFQTAYVQWQHDLRLLKMREKLVLEKANSEQQLIDARNDESKSRLTYLTAQDKLRIFGVPEEQIEPLLKNLGDLPLPKELHSISDKARMTRTSPVAGIVIQRDAVPGNLYDNNDVLMVIAPLDHLFVWVNVYEADQAKVAVGQDLEIKFPYLDQTIPAKVQYVASEVSKDTRAIMLRASIPNVDRKLKADMLVRAELKIPPIAGQTVIPRQSMVVINGNEYAFVQKEHPDPDDKYERFERRQLVVAEERDEHVVVKKGLSAGEHVASNGSLVLAQLYEDQQMIATGMPLK